MSNYPRRAFACQAYGPVAATLTTAPLRPARVRHGSGVVVDGGSTERLLFPLPTPAAAAATVRAWLKPRTAAGGQTRGIAELSGGVRPLSLRYTATQVLATDGLVTAAVGLALTADSVAFASASIGAAGITVMALLADGTAASTTVAATPATYSTLDIGNAVGQSKADAAIEEVVFSPSQVTVGDLTTQSQTGDPSGLDNDQRATLIALVPDVPNLTQAISIQGAGAVRATGTVYPAYIDALPADSAYVAAGAVELMTAPVGHGLVVGQYVEVRGFFYTVIAITTGALTDSIYLGFATSFSPVGGYGYGGYGQGGFGGL